MPSAGSNSAPVDSRSGASGSRVVPPRRWAGEVDRLVKGERVEIPLAGLKHASLRTTLRSALLHRGLKLNSRRSNGIMAFWVAPKNTRAGKEILGATSTVAAAMNPKDAELLRIAATQRGITVSRIIREAMDLWWTKQGGRPR